MLSNITNINDINNIYENIIYYFLIVLILVMVFYICKGECNKYS